MGIGISLLALLMIVLFAFRKRNRARRADDDVGPRADPPKGGPRSGKALWDDDVDGQRG